MAPLSLGQQDVFPQFQEQAPMSPPNQNGVRYYLFVEEKCMLDLRVAVVGHPYPTGEKFFQVLEYQAASYFMLSPPNCRKHIQIARKAR